VFFYGSSAPSLTGQNANPGSAAFWDDNKNSSTKHGGASGAPRALPTTSTFHASGDSCNAPSSHSESSSCQTWCYARDTLVYLFAATSRRCPDQLSGVSFGSGAQSMPMTRVTKYHDDRRQGRAGQCRCRDLVCAQRELRRRVADRNAVSSVQGPRQRIDRRPLDKQQLRYHQRSARRWGAHFTVGRVFPLFPNQIISVGDTVTRRWRRIADLQRELRHDRQSADKRRAGGALGGRGTYRLSAPQTVAAANNRQWTINSNVLHVTSCSICFFAQRRCAERLASGRSINARRPRSPTPTASPRRRVVSGATR
jgi:hypothetical protein